MATCNHCGTSILFGGPRSGPYRYCNDKCKQNDVVALKALELSQDDVDDVLFETHASQCPRCEGPGPVDVHESYRILSVFLFTSWSTRRHISCVRCGRKQKLADVVFCFFLGWWGFPFGLICTPLQIGRNIYAICRPPDPLVPSKELEEVMRLHVAAAMLEEEAQEAAAAENELAQQPDFPEPMKVS